MAADRGTLLGKGVIKQLALLFLLASASYAADIAQEQFGYLNTNESPAVIDATQAQDLLNVDVTPGGKSVKKRSGYGLYKALSGSQAIHGGYHFFDSSGNDVQIWGSSTSLWGIVNDGTPAQLVSSATLNTTWQCTDAQGFAYCVDSNRDALIKTNGATITWYPAPLGTIVAITPERLLVAGSSTTPNTIAYSAANNFTNFTVGINVQDASTEQIAAPGSKLTHMTYACNRWLWWKDQSFGYVLGTDQTNLVIKTVSGTVGTQDNSDAVDPNGNVYFRGQDGHVYQYDCNTITQLTVDITPTIQASGRKTSNSWTQTTQSDFNAGSFTNTSSSVSVNDVTLATNTLANVSNYSFETAGAGTDASGWTRTGSGLARVSGGFINFGGCVMVVTPSNGSYAMHTVGGAIVQLIDSATSNVLSEVTLLDSCSPSIDTVATLTPPTTSYGTLGKIRIRTTVSDYVTSDTPFTIGSPITFRWSGYQLSQHWVDFFQNVSTITAGSYYSAVRNAPSLTSWDTFSAHYTNVGASSHTFFTRASTSSFTLTSSTPAWVAQTVGSLVSASTGTYFQVRDDFTTDVVTNTITLNDFTFNWFEGNASDKAYAVYFNNAVWWTMAYGPGQTTNNYIFKFDLINRGWTLYGFGAGGFLIQNNSLYFGATSGGKIERADASATSDDGAAINAYWKSKDFGGSDVFLENNYKQVDLLARRNSGQTLSVGYAVNGSTATTSFSVSLSSTTNSTIRYKKLLPNSASGGLFNIKFSDNTTTSAWEVLGYRIRFDAMSYEPTR